MQEFKNLNGFSVKDDAARKSIIDLQGDLYDTKIELHGRYKHVANPNLLINSDFRSPINQRGKTSYTATTNFLYTVDRWRIADHVTLEVIDGAVLMDGSVTNVKLAEGSVTADKLADDIDLGGIEMVKLWENASPASAMGAQTISLDLNEYDAVKVVCYLSTSVSQRINAFGEITGNTKNGFLAHGVYGDGKIFAVYRPMYVDKNGVELGNAYKSTPSTDVTDLSCAIPCKIYGIKGVIE